MALIFHDEEFAKKNQKIYMDRKFFSRYEDQVAALRDSKWVYVGNLSFHTSEAQLHALFSRVGSVRGVIMGLNSKTKTPCGFGFVEFMEPCAALESVALLSGTVLDGRQIRVELDFGYKNGRHFGRGQSGGQVRDDRKEGFDPGRTWASSITASSVTAGQGSGSYGPSGGASSPTASSPSGGPSSGGGQEKEGGATPGGSSDGDDDLGRDRRSRLSRGDDDDEEEEGGRAAKRLVGGQNLEQ